MNLKEFKDLVKNLEADDNLKVVCLDADTSWLLDFTGFEIKESEDSKKLEVIIYNSGY